MIIITSKFKEFSGTIELTYAEIDFIDRSGSTIERVVTFKPCHGITKFKDDSFNIKEI